MVKIAASILSADFRRLEEQSRAALEAGVDWIHVDVMDGHFVPNISVGLPIVRALRPLCDETGAVMDVHLMIEQPERYVAEFAAAGADILTVHVEASPHLHRTLQQIRGEGVRAGVAVNPGTPLAALEEVLTEIDLVLVMSVNPGFSGQSYIAASTPKLARLKQLLNAAGLHPHLQVDGGVKPRNAPQIVEAGANVLVAASAIFDGEIEDNVRALRRASKAVGQI